MLSGHPSRHPYLEIKDTGKYGTGVYAVRNIAKDSVIHVLSGETITLHELVHRINNGQESINDPLQVGKRTYIDLDEFSHSFNHSCNPNAGIRKRSELFALRVIGWGEEITYDYSVTIAPTVWQMKCDCGSKNCRKVLGDVRTIPKRELSKYMALGAVQRYMKACLKRPSLEIPKYEIAALNTIVKTSEHP
jgi:uncharacterized protein